MTLHLPISQPGDYAIPEKSLRRWATERLHRNDRADGGADFSFVLSGSTCNNIALTVMMTVAVDSTGRIESATARPASGDTGSGAMCAADGDGAGFLGKSGRCDEVIGMTLQEAAFREWHPEASGCFCTAGNRRHKWRNVLQAIYYATSRMEADYHLSP